MTTGLQYLKTASLGTLLGNYIYNVAWNSYYFDAVRLDEQGSLNVNWSRLNEVVGVTALGTLLNTPYISSYSYYKGGLKMGVVGSMAGVYLSTGEYIFLILAPILCGTEGACVVGAAMVGGNILEEYKDVIPYEIVVGWVSDFIGKTNEMGMELVPFQG